jgi:spore maturation protein CgeB
MDNYLDKLKSIDDKSVKALLKVLKFQIKILGTDVVIEKYDQEGEHRKAFGALFQTDDFTKVKKSSKASRYIINRNYLNNHYQKQTQPLMVLHDKPELSVGDTISFYQDNVLYRFKVETKNSYGLSPHVLYRYELMGIPEDTLDSSTSGDSC